VEDSNITCNATCTSIEDIGDGCNERDVSGCATDEECKRFKGFWYCNDTGVCTCRRKGIRYVQIDDNGGARTPQERKGNAFSLNAVWIDTNGSTCQYPGVYIADPNTNMVVCTSPVDTIGWWRYPGKRSPGFYINVDGKDVLFAYEWGEIVTENLGQFALTDPDTTLVATPKMYGTDVGYVYFNESDHTWNATYTPPSDEYYVHNTFDIDFYPNRPTSAGGKTPTTLHYTQGVGYNMASTGATVTNLSAPSQSGYTFRGYYPGAKDVMSDDDFTGTVWPGSKGGITQVPLENKKWVLATMDPNFSKLKLYAAWAENCVDPIYCSLNVDTNGGVRYTTTCPTGYENRGSGVGSKCVDPNELNWTGLEFPGATVAY
jgi:hypothetical protein